MQKRPILKTADPSSCWWMNHWGLGIDDAVGMDAFVLWWQENYPDDRRSYQEIIQSDDFAWAMEDLQRQRPLIRLLFWCKGVLYWLKTSGFLICREFWGIYKKRQHNSINMIK